MLVGRRKLRGERSAISIDESVVEGSFAGRIPAHRALSECARGFMLHAHLYSDASRERQLRSDRGPSRVTYFAPLTLTSEREREIPEHPD
jgi:hypothetical protein